MKNILYIAFTLFCSLSIYPSDKKAEPIYVTRQITKTKEGRIIISLSTTSKRIKRKLVDKSTDADDIKKEWFTLTDQPLMKFTYDSGKDYSPQIKKISDEKLNEKLKEKVEQAHAVFKNHVKMIQEAFATSIYPKPSSDKKSSSKKEPSPLPYTTTVDIELLYNPYAAENRILYNAVRNLGFVVGVELPDVAFHWTKPWIRRGMYATLLVAGAGLLYYNWDKVPSLSDVGRTVESGGKKIQSFSDWWAKPWFAPKTSSPTPAPQPTSPPTPAPTPAIASASTPTP